MLFLKDKGDQPEVYALQISFPWIVLSFVSRNLFSGKRMRW